MKTISILGAAAILWAAAIPCYADAQGVPPLSEAKSARIAGEPHRSLKLIDAWLAEHPDDPDAWLEKGFAQIAVSDFPGARRSFQRTLKLSPNYDDAEIGLARLDYFEGDYPSALSRLAGRDDNDEARALLEQIRAARAARTQTAFRADASVEHSELSGGLSDWTSVALSLSSRVSGATAVAGTVEHTRRFSRDDVYVQLQVDHAPRAGVTFYGGAGGTVEADFRPRAVLFAGGEIALPGRRDGAPELDFTLYTSGADYTSGQVITFSPGLNARFYDDKVTLRNRIIVLSDEAGDLRTGYAQEILLSATPKFGVRLGWSDAPETSDGQTLDVQSTSISANWAITDRIGAAFGAVLEERSAYDRNAFMFSINRMFQ